MCLLGMQMIKKISFSLMMVTVLMWAIVEVAHADQTIVSGGGTVRQEYDSNIHRTNDNRISEWTTAFSPTLKVMDKGRQHSFSLQYSPSVVYSQLTDDERWDHWLSANLNKGFSERVSFYARDTFLRAEDPFYDEEVGIELSDYRGRNRYWVNNAATGIRYDYGKESFVKLSYLNQILENEDSAEDDYVKHTPGLSIGYRFGVHWQIEVDYLFTKGNFEQDDDLENHSGDLYISYHPSPSSKIFGHGGYTANNYNGLQYDYDLKRISLGYANQLSATLDIQLQAGGVFLVRDVLEDQEAFYYQMSINKKLQHGAISLAGVGGIDEQQFDGTSVQDVSRYWQVKADYQYNLTQNLLSSVTCLYREDRFWERRPEQKEEKLQAQASLTYSFGRWYTATVKYAYSRQEADILVRCYDDNRVFLELGFNKDFFRW